MITSYVARIEENPTYSFKYYLMMTNKRKLRIDTLWILVTFVLEICHYVDHNHLFCDICYIYSLLLLDINSFYKIMILFIFSVTL